jgi:hypothetical protein
MAALPESNTRRYWLVYTVGGQEHRILMRSTSSVTDAAAVLEAEGWWTDLSVDMATDAIFIGMEVALAGSNIRNPLAITAPIPGTGGGTITDIQRPRSWTIKGRTEGGRRVGVSVFGVLENTPNTWEQSPITITGLADILTRMQGSTGFWVGIDGLHPTWYDRVTVTYNDHWVDVARG